VSLFRLLLRGSTFALRRPHSRLLSRSAAFVKGVARFESFFLSPARLLSILLSISVWIALTFYFSLFVSPAACLYLFVAFSFEHCAPRMKSSLSGDTTPCRMTGATLRRSSYTGLFPQTLEHWRCACPSLPLPSEEGTTCLRSLK